MSERPKRKLPSKPVEKPVKLPRTWRGDEMKTLLDCLIVHGHKNLSMFENCFPHRTVENVKTFLRTIHATAIKSTKGHESLDYWIKKCSVEVAPWRDCVQVAQVIKYLSVDGLLENHPLPENCQGIDFRQAYRLIYQALMGYPVQPVNQETADFIMETLAELNNEISKENDAIKNLGEFLNGPECHTSGVRNKESGTSNNKPEEKKPVRVYERKKPKLQGTGEPPSLKIVVEESGTNCSGSTKSFSVTVEGSNSSPAVIVDVPVVPQKSVDEDEEDLLKSSSYNPFKIPSKWLEGPLYLNLKQKP